MKKGKKYLVFACFIFLLMKNITKAQNQFSLEKDPNGSTYMIIKGEHKWQLYFHLIRDNSSNDLLYCLEPGVALSEEAYEELNEWEYEKLNLDETDKNYITKVAYFGWNNKDHQDLNYYYAAQLLIWEKIIPEDWKIFFTDRLGGYAITPFEKEKEEILELIRNDEKIPSFANQTYEYLKSLPQVLIDHESSLKSYKMVPNDSVKLTINENKIHIEKVFEKEATLTFQKEYEGEPLKFYYRSDGQNVLKRGSLLPKSFQIHLKPYETEFEILKIDEEKKGISDVVFELSQKKDGEKIFLKNLTTDENGKIKISNLELGDYCIREISAPKEYDINPKEQCFSLTKEEKKKSLTITNYWKKTKLILLKIDADTKETLKKVHFQVKKQDQILFDGFTNEQGIIVLENLTKGTYEILEIETIDGYKLEKEAKIIVIDGTEEEIKITIKNHKLTNVPNTKEQASYNINPIFYEERKKKK